VSELPLSWDVVSLQRLVRMGSGGTPRAGEKRYYEGGSIPWAVIGDLNDGLVTETKQLITDAAIAESSAKIVPQNAVLLAMYGSIGKLGLAAKPMATNQAIATLVPHDGLIAPRWLFWFLLSQRRELTKRGAGAAQRNISQTILRDWPIPIPPLDEQLRIVGVLEDYLSRLDAARAYVDTASRRSTNWLRVAIDAGITAGGTVTVRLSDLIQRVEAGRSFGGSAPPARDDEWGVVRVSSMTWGQFRPQENKAVPHEQVDPRYEIRTGDVLVSRANTSAYVGAPVLVERTRPRLLLSDKSLRLVPQRNVDPRWLVEVLGTRSVRRQVSALATGTKDSMRNISQASLLSVVVPHAPIDQQHRLTDAVGEIKTQAGRLDSALASASARGDALRQHLLSAAFVGQL
jgi:type I restriction enzyme S subunit